ncbi:putative nucleic acid-binding protein [Halarchaeum rubridurum]|uniref:Putative nucleic acid-binding protein n=1 Tax=Halarchaeum rubridurum TaxID=489911 RepID=A0A8T4GQD3_9EURY|nr:hypothetical protein [Halarchaeum rubridurum]MBP1955850.1 putative nucleic acid-binding protein [Halarchaeum rubridurum]
MTALVADTSALVSLGTAVGHDPNPLDLCFDIYDVHVPQRVSDDLRKIASYDDVHADAATAVLDRDDAVSVTAVTLDADFPLDDGENAAVTLANDLEAALFLCDEFNSLGLVHASLADTRLVTTPTLLSVFVRNDQLSSTDALAILDSISDGRSWETNSYVKRARTLLNDT